MTINREKGRNGLLFNLDYGLTHFGIACLIIVCFLLLAASLATTFLFPDANYEQPYNSLKYAIVSVPVTVALGVCLYRANRKLEKIPVGRFRVTCCVAIAIIGTLWASIFSNYSPVSDQWTVVESARLLHVKDYYDLELSGVLKWYPFQAGYVLWSELIGALFGFSNWTAFRLTGICSLPVILWAISSSVQLLFKKPALTNISSLMCVMFLPLAFYSTFIYGTLPSLACAVLAINMQIQAIIIYKKTITKSTIYAILSCSFIFLSLWFKLNSLIFLIAIEIVWLITMIVHKRYIFIIFIVLNIFLYFFAGAIPISIISTRSGIEYGSGVPKSAWIAMGMQESSRAPGWYNGYVSKFWKNAEVGTSEAFKESDNIARQEIYERLSFFAQNPQKMVVFFGEKILSQWSEPTFQSFWCTYTGDGTVSADGTMPGLSTQFDSNSIMQVQLLRGIVHKILVIYCDSFQTTIYILSLLSFIVLYKRRTPIHLMIFSIVFLGGFIFHTIWEAKSCYTMSYFLMLIPYAAFGLSILAESKNMKNIKQ